jgi:Asp-tRNA(Asn)/Glu-tRNA(Gln) amidotransferase A subunit family amidase
MICVQYDFTIFSDIGGSLRIPAHFSGIHSFKPSYSRLSNLGTSSYKPVHIAVEPVMGPMATCAEDLKLFCMATFGHSAPDVFPLHFSSTFDDNKPLVYAYSTKFPFMDVSPICKRSVMDTIERLRSNGHKVIQYEFPENFEKLAYYFYKIMSADGWEFYFEKLKKEPVEKNLRPLLNYAALPNWIKSIASWISGLLLKDCRAIEIIKSISKKDVYSLHKIQIEIDEISRNFRESIDILGIDILIMPVHVLPATPIGSFSDIHFCAAHTFMWNLLNQPIGTLSISSFDLSKDIVKDVWPRKFIFSDIFSNNLLDLAAQNFYNPENAIGLPSGIQLIGKANEDEKVIEAMIVIEKLFKK